MTINRIKNLRDSIFILFESKHMDLQRMRNILSLRNQMMARSIWGIAPLSGGEELRKEEEKLQREGKL
jgi:hypothetical protein